MISCAVYPCCVVHYRVIYMYISFYVQTSFPHKSMCYSPSVDVSFQGGKGIEEVAKKVETEAPNKNVEEKTVGPTQEEYDKLQEGVLTEGEYAVCHV